MSVAKAISAKGKGFKPRITVFHCVSALTDASVLDSSGCDIQVVKMPCGIATREVFLLRALESGADAVVALVCPEGQCRHLQGNIRAAKRVARMKKLVDEIGLDGRRLNLFNISRGDAQAAERAIKQTASDVASLGPNPAA
ncbi:MAG: hydrogenase iron-sulfur subunit [Chloroflexi bacterium]|nr:hydrogenase iron-sulfur subunit [Chloroflexota bacterium]